MFNYKRNRINTFENGIGNNLLQENGRKFDGSSTSHLGLD